MKKLFIIIIVSLSILSCNSGTTTPTPNNNGVTINQVSQIVHDSLHQFNSTLDMVYGRRDTTYDDELVSVEALPSNGMKQILWRVNILNSEGVFSSNTYLVSYKEPTHIITIKGQKNKTIYWTITKEEVISQ